MRTLMICALTGAIAGALVLGGCSGAGLSAFDARGGSLQTVAADHLAALVLVRSWLVALHAAPAGSESESFTQDVLPDGSVHIVGTVRDGSALDYVVRPDNSGEGTWTLPDGRLITIVEGPLQQEGAIYTQVSTETFWDGMVLQRTIVSDFSGLLPVVTSTGDATLPDGRAMEFEIVKRAREREDVTVELPDGSRCEYRVPLFGVFSRVDYSQEVVGHYLSPAGARQDFTLAGRGSRWVSWSLTDAEGVIGEFSLDPNYAGDGTLRDTNGVVGALRWDADAAGVLDLLGAGASQVGPTGAALDFALDRWIAHAALLGPSPSY